MENNAIARLPPVSAVTGFVLKERKEGFRIRIKDTDIILRERYKNIHVRNHEDVQGLGIEKVQPTDISLHTNSENSVPMQTVSKH